MIKIRLVFILAFILLFIGCSDYNEVVCYLGYDTDIGVFSRYNEFLQGESYCQAFVNPTRRDLYARIYSRQASALRVFVEKEENMNVESKTAKVISRDDKGNIVDKKLIKFYRNEYHSTSSHYAFTSQIVEYTTGNNLKGKSIFFIAGEVPVISPDDPFETIRVAEQITENQKYVKFSLRVIFLED